MPKGTIWPQRGSLIGCVMLRLADGVERGEGALFSVPWLKIRVPGFG